MDLAFTDAEQAFAAEVRAWLAEHLEVPPDFADADEEIAWGRAWQAQLAADQACFAAKAAGRGGFRVAGR